MTLRPPFHTTTPRNVQLTFENITVSGGIGLHVGSDGVPLEPGNNYVPLIANLRLANIAAHSCKLDCSHVNGSHCYNTTVAGSVPSGCAKPPPTPPAPVQTFGCKREAHTMFGVVTLPWAVCIPLGAPVNNDPAYPNWGPVEGNFPSLSACHAACH